MNSQENRENESKCPVVYLFTLGCVKDFRASMDINDNYPNDLIVAKYGVTNNIERTRTEMKKYKDVTGVAPELKYHVYIDPQYKIVAENDIDSFFDTMIFNNDMVIIPPDFFGIIGDKYNQIDILYAGHIREVVDKIKEYEELISKDKQYRDELLLEIRKREIETYKSNKEIQKRRHIEQELRMQIEMARLNIS